MITVGLSVEIEILFVDKAIIKVLYALRSQC